VNGGFQIKRSIAKKCLTAHGKASWLKPQRGLVWLCGFLMLAGSGCASIKDHWDEPPPDVKTTGWQIFHPGDFFGSWSWKP
jgi:hypothetical protein